MFVVFKTKTAIAYKTQISGRKYPIKNMPSVTDLSKILMAVYL